VPIVVKSVGKSPADDVAESAETRFCDRLNPELLLNLDLEFCSNTTALRGQ